MILVYSFFGWVGVRQKTPVCVRIGGGDKRGADEPKETRTAESWERDVGVRRFWSFLFVSFVSVCRTVRTEVSCKRILLRSRAVSVGALRQSAPGLCASEGDQGSTGAPLACFSFNNAKKVDSAPPHRHSRALMPIWLRSGVFLKWFLPFGQT